MAIEPVKNDPPEVSSHKKILPIYPVLIGIYSVLALAALNISQIDFSAAFRSILFAAVLASTLMVLLRLVMRSWLRAALLAFLWLILFFSYGHIYLLLKNTNLLGVAIGRHRYLLLVWIILAVVMIWFASRKWINLVTTTKVLNVLSVLLLVFPIFQIGAYELSHANLRPRKQLAATPSTVQANFPDIYYIVLDSYMRSDQLSELMGYDNSDFLASLEGRGFYIAGCSQSNYAYTNMSLGSSLNMDYLDALVASQGQAAELIQTSTVRQYLTEKGYTIVAFETGYRWSQWEDADVYIKFQRKSTAINNFEELFLETTLLRIPIDYGVQAKIAGTSITYASIHHDMIIYELGSLENMPASIRSPKFIFAHLVVPHAPYVFGPNGELVAEDPGVEGQFTGYRNNVAFIDSEILKVVDSILANSRIPPVIIIQGDHGSLLYNTPTQLMGILNAYYIPGAMVQLYPSITPVNTFRVIFNTEFGQNYPLLPDVSWFSEKNDRSHLQEMDNPCGK